MRPKASGQLRAGIVGIEVLWLAVSFLWASRTGGAESRANSVVSAGPLSAYEPGSVTAFL